MRFIYILATLIIWIIFVVFFRTMGYAVSNDALLISVAILLASEFVGGD